MKGWLCTIKPIPGRPDIAWAILPIGPKEKSYHLIHKNNETTVAGNGVQCLSLNGEKVEPHRHGVTVLRAVGYFETPAQMIDLIIPMMVDKARRKIDELDHAAMIHPRWRPHIEAAFVRRPYENALWILKATPEELKSWAKSLD